MDVSKRRGPVMVVGPTRAGKSTLLHALSLMAGEVKKTQNIIYSAQAIDTPGEMAQLPFLYNAFILNSARASLVLFLANAHRPVRLPPRIAVSMKAPVVGVVSQIDIAEPDFIRRAEQALRNSGVKTIFHVSSITGEGLPELKAYIEERVEN
jgi:ethanolamine utilization protein EutP